MRARRALLYVPGSDTRKIDKATTLGVDSVCLDLEDGVAASRKLDARATLACALMTRDFGRSERLARINAVGSGLETGDLEAALSGRPDGIVIPKVDDPDQVKWTSARILAEEQSRGWPAGGIGLIAMIESARAIVRLAENRGLRRPSPGVHLWRRGFRSGSGRRAHAGGYRGALCS